MKKTILLLAFIAVQTVVCMAQIGTWKAYSSYHNITQIQPAGNIIYVLASNSLYAYNTQDNSIQTFDKTNLLNDVDISHIAYNPLTKRLLIVYKNYNIDILSKNGNVKNISDYHNKVMMNDKTINFITIDQQFAYLSTSFGIIKINMDRQEISDTYHFKEKVHSCAIYNNQIYAALENKILVGNSSLNLLDRKNWKELPDIQLKHLYHFDNQLIGSHNGGFYIIHDNGTLENKYTPWYINVFLSNGKLIYMDRNHIYLLSNINKLSEYNVELTAIAYDIAKQKYWVGTPDGKLQLVSITNDNQLSLENTYIKIDAPQYNNFGAMIFAHNKLYTVGGGHTQTTELHLPATIQIMQQNDNWTIVGDQLQTKTNNSYTDNTIIAVNPNDETHIFAAGKTGLYEFKNNQLIQYYNYNNSPLKTALDNPSLDYILVKGITFDKEGNLWLLNSQAKSQSLLQFTKDRKWISHHKPQLMVDKDRSLGSMEKMFFDSRGLLWFVNNHSTKPSFYAYNKTTDELKEYTSFDNEEGKHIITQGVRCITEDLDHNIWIGTTVGPLVLPAQNVDSSTDLPLHQIKIPRNDETNLADYLLESIDINCIIMDPAGRKWIGTATNGAYLVSENNLEQVHHFTAQNSKLLDNNVQSIAINQETGTIYFATAKGLCSYQSDATLADKEINSENVYAYPNPVEPGYTGLITIIGLSFNADVKIITTNGSLVAQGKSLGGTFTWNGNDLQGKPVASGVYMVQTATNDGNKGIVTRIAIIR